MKDKNYALPDELKDIYIHLDQFKNISLLRKDHYAAEINKKKVTMRYCSDSKSFDEDARVSRSQAANPFVTPLVFVSVDESKYYGFTGYIIIDGIQQSLAELFQKKPLPLKQRLLIALDVAAGLEILHETTHKTHQKLTSNNILIDDRGRARLTDFSVRDMADTTVGEGVYIGAEVGDTSNPQPPGTDIYSLGQVLLALVLWDEPKKKNDNTILENFPIEKLVKLIDDCCAIDRIQRPTAAQIVTRLNEILSELNSYAELYKSSDFQSLHLSFNNEKQRDYCFALLTEGGNTFEEDQLIQIEHSFGVDLANKLKLQQKQQCLVRSTNKQAPFTISMLVSPGPSFTLYPILTPNIFSFFKMIFYLPFSSTMDKEGIRYLVIGSQVVFSEKLLVLLLMTRMDCEVTANLYKTFTSDDKIITPEQWAAFASSQHSCKEERFTCIFSDCKYLPELSFNPKLRSLSWRGLPAATSVILDDALDLELRNSLKQGHPENKKSYLLTILQQLVFEPLGLPWVITQLIFKYIPTTSKKENTELLKPKTSSSLFWKKQSPAIKRTPPALTH